MISLSPDETLDDLLHGRLKLIQHRRGLRYSVDALLLSAFSLPLAAGEDVLDLGCGAGVIALILACRGRPARVVGVELQPELAALALRNAGINPTEPRVQIIVADATRLDQVLEPQSFGLIVTNPPFRPAETGRPSPNPEKALARHELAMNLGLWLGQAKALLRHRGRICLVYPVDQEPRLNQTIENLGLHPRRKQYALDRPGGSRKLVLVELGLDPGELMLEPEIPIETGQGKFSLDGYR